MTTALTIPSPSDWQVMREVAGALLKSGQLAPSIKSPEAVIAIMLQARELNIGPMTALRGIDVIQGKPTISPQLMLALIYSSGKLDAIHIDGDDTQCTVLMKRTGLREHTETFTIDHAKKLGLVGKDNWQKQIAVMLRWRAVASCARVVFPDVIFGLYTADEMGADVAFTDDGDLQVDSRPAHVVTVTGEIVDEAIPFADAPVVELPTDAEIARYQRGLSMAKDLSVTLPAVFYSITGREPRTLFLQRMGELGQFIQAAQADRSSAEPATDAQEALI